MSDQVGESKVVIRCALQSFDDTTVICPHDWTVRRLKQHLRDVCPGEPCPDRQRLIYAGQCLQDDRKLDSVLRRPSDPDGSQVIHMVCPPTDKSRLEQEADLRRRRPVVNPSPPTAAMPTMTTSNWAGMYGGMTPPAAGSPVDWQQAQQQMYQAYMFNYANYMQQMFGALNGSPGFAGTTPFPAFFPATPPQTPIVAAVPAHAFAHDQVPAPAPVVAPAEPPMNAQGGVVPDEDELRERDWLDWVYTGIRAALLATVIYFYSTPERLLGVALFVLAMWALQGGWNNFRRVLQPNNNARPPPPANNVVVGENANQPAADANADGDGSRPEVVALEPSAWVVFWSTCYTFVTSFFASLIPENAAPLNVN